MPGKHLFEYAVLRVVPRVGREEFLNAGVVLYAKSLRYLDCRTHLHRGKLALLSPLTDAEEVNRYLEVFHRICRGDRAGGPIASLDLPSRFRWLTATRSTILQSSKTHPGLCDDPEATLDRLMAELVK